MSAGALSVSIAARHLAREANTADESMTFEAQFRQEFAEGYDALARYLARLTGDPASAADFAQEAFVRLFARGSMPDQPRAWLVSVAHNLLRNEQTQAARRLQLLHTHAAAVAPRQIALPPDASLEAAERRQSVQRALQSLPERERQLLLLRYDGFSYREIAQALHLHEASVGTLLARAKTQFRSALGTLLQENRDA